MDLAKSRGTGSGGGVWLLMFIPTHGRFGGVAIFAGRLGPLCVRIMVASVFSLDGLLRD